MLWAPDGIKVAVAGAEPTAIAAIIKADPKAFMRASDKVPLNMNQAVRQAEGRGLDEGAR
jgi:hypothetical protein